ncbi:MAG: FAD:protein FMN transferase [Clostridia bacterium]|nr:FAD:protein FMN transferase [Clostridia bacterium]
MKFKRYAAAICAVACLAAASGCAQPTYYIYTNISDGGYEISDKAYTVGGVIDGCTVTTPQEEELKMAGYTSRQKLYFSMLADAALVVSTDFSTDAARSKFDEFTAEVGNLLIAIDKALSTTVADSDVNKFNKASAGQTVELREISFEVFSEAKAVYEITEGYYNPALYYNIFAYGFGGATKRPLSESELPSDEVIAKYTDLSTHFGEIELKEEDGRYFVTKPEYTVEVDGEALSLKLDLGGIGKGYAVDKVDELFDKYGYEYGYFNFGSSSMLVKSNVLNGAYNISFGGPRSPSRDPYVKTHVRNEKISTSGDNEQFYRIGNKRYCHIIDPTTGKPVQTGIAAVTVIGGSAASADAITTAVMAMGRERAVKFIEEELTGRRVIFACE